MTRSFDDKPAARQQVPLMIGLVGPSGGGKTYSALRLATGIQRVSGGDIYFIDTEARRLLHYADKFKFRHLEFGSPFGPLDYLAAIEHCVKKGAKTIIVDSMSHEHEGPGGVLEMHEAECERMAKAWNTSREKVQMTAWAKPKSERRRMINSILQLQCNFIFCFRAKEKIKIYGGKAPVELGFMPIAGEEFVYEMTVNALLLPNAGGVPTWQSSEVGEKMMIKLPEQFKSIFAKQQPMSEDLGEELAKWAAGSNAEVPKATTKTTSVQPDLSDARRKLLNDIRTATHERYPDDAPDAKKLRLELVDKACGKKSWAELGTLSDEDLELTLDILKSMPATGADDVKPN